MRTFTVVIVLFAFAAAACNAQAKTWHVDAAGKADFRTIQPAIDAAANGDTVVVKDGTYSGTGNIEIDLKGKQITLRSESGHERCVIDCAGAGRAFNFGSNENTRTVIDGFTIKNGYAAGDGAGILCTSGSPVIINVVIINCRALGSGGAICITEGSPRITNVIMAGNTARGSGGGVCGRSGNPLITNCTVYGNSAGSGGGVFLDGGNAMLTNTILWEDAARGGPEIALGETANLSVRHCNVKGNRAAVQMPEAARLSWATDNFEVYPCFAAPGDLHLLAHSPCVDTGLDNPPGGRPPKGLDGNPRLLDGDGNGNVRIDMGAFERNPHRPSIALSPTELILSATGGKVDRRILSIRNCGGKSLQWTVTEDSPWLKATPAAGQSMGEMNEVVLEADLAGLKHGEHTTTLTVSAPDAANSPRTVRVTLAISGMMRVPTDFPTIQEAIDAAIDGDEILLADGVHRGEGNRDIDFRGKAILLRSENGPEKCIIDCEGKGKGFYFHSNESRNSVLEGITLKNGFVPPMWPDLAVGGGITCQGASPTIMRNIITGNTGSGIYCIGPSAPVIKSNMIVNNIADWGGCGIYAAEGSAPVIINNTIVGNPGGGIRAWGGAATVANCIIWGNGEDIGGARPRNCCIPGIEEGDGNISFYPYFVDPLNGDYRLQSYSPCIDAGDDSVIEITDRDIDGHPRNIYRSADIGADEKTFISGDSENNNLGDGLPDQWEQKYFGDVRSGPWDDPDEDGRTNRDEFLRGTSPVENQQNIYVDAASADDPGANGTRRSPFPTIQQGVDAATATVYVCAGTYNERVTINGKTLDIQGGYDGQFAERDPAKHKTIIDAGGVYRGVTFVNVEGGSLTGFVITGGNAYHGGGVCFALSSPRISNNVITGNKATCGGAVECGWQSAPTLENNVIAGNTAQKSGGGIYCWGEANATITSNTIVQNTAGESGGAISCVSEATATVANCILWGNGDKVSEITLQAPSILNIGYSLLGRGKNTILVEETSSLSWLKGNIEGDPLFADPAKGGFHLKSKFGRWSAATGEWIKDKATSPCIDAGDPAADHSNESAPNGRRINLGAYGNTERASRSKE